MNTSPTPDKVVSNAPAVNLSTATAPAASARAALLQELVTCLREAPSGAGVTARDTMSTAVGDLVTVGTYWHRPQSGRGNFGVTGKLFPDLRLADVEAAAAQA